MPVLHNSAKENFSILCNVLQLPSAEEIAAKLVKSYISEKLKLSKYPSKHQRSFAMTAGCLVGMMGLGTNQNYIRGSSYPFAAFARPAEACLPLSVPCCYLKFSLAEENSAKSYCFRGFKRLKSASLKMSGKCEMAAGPVVMVRLGSYLGLKSRGGYLPPVEFAGPAELYLFLLVPRCLSTSKPNSAAEFVAKLCFQFRILSKRENRKENSVRSYCFRRIKCLKSASLKMSGKCEMAVGPVVTVWLGSYLGLKSRRGHFPPLSL